MKKQNDPTDRKLPVTAEVGGEGGSSADATLQVETFSGPAGNERADPAIVGEPDAVVKHATEPPESRTP
jgi:hypothetical protein